MALEALQVLPDSDSKAALETLALYLSDPSQSRYMYIHTHIHTYIHTYIYMYVCTRIYLYVYVNVYSYIHIDIDIYIRIAAIPANPCALANFLCRADVVQMCGSFVVRSRGKCSLLRIHRAVSLR